MRDKDGAAEALRTVLDLPPHKRNVSLTGRLARIERLLNEAPWSGDADARQLAERISVWLSETSARPLAWAVPGGQHLRFLFLADADFGGAVVVADLPAVDQPPPGVPRGQGEGTGTEGRRRPRTTPHPARQP
ncbi:hypothetical protein [Micromonospora sp. KC606]|uniref:hypothetical protein n=1 Tax=Micromonospora sp. KC606 TaxID=2530379 RepID=UPI001FB6E7DD|nr:hypothetical protein [Micromonospora sp. KC606]